ncbi:uncharacterized protein [Panulirus ornatus]
MNLFDFLKTVHQRGKREQKKRKGKSVCCEDDDNSEPISSTSRPLHLNNLNDNKDILSKVNISQLLDTSFSREAHENLKDLDVTFLLNFLSNDILRFPLDSQIYNAVNEIKEIRNDVFHSGSRIEYSDVHQKLNDLCDATGLIHSYLGESKDDLERMKLEYLQESVSLSDTLFYVVFEELKKEVHDRYSRPQHSILPSIEHFRVDDQHTGVVESLEKFLLEYKIDAGKDMQPIIMCGAPGVGKTCILHNLASVICHNSEKSDFSLVLYLDTRYRITQRPSVWEQVNESIKNLAPKTVGGYGINLLKSVVNAYVDKILFLADWNIHCLKDIGFGMQKGTWVITYRGTPENSCYCQVLKVSPLNETQVHLILQSIISNEEQVKHICKLYEKCDYKGLLTSPDIVHIFVEIGIETGRSVACKEILHHFIKRKVNIENRDKELLKLGKTAFYLIKKNGKYYSDSNLAEIESEARDPFLEYHGSKGYTFKYRVIEDYLAAMYVVAEPLKACKEWLDQITLFKRVFRFACCLWFMNDQNIHTYLPFMISYLMKCFGTEELKGRESRNQKRNKQLRRPNSSEVNGKGEAMGIDVSEEGMEVDVNKLIPHKIRCHNSDSVEEFSSKNNFTKWSFLIKVAEDCQYHPEVLRILRELLSSKECWQFKCKFLDENKIENIALVLNQIELKKPLRVKLESGTNVKILRKLWEMLSSLRCLQDNSSVQIMVIHKNILSAQHERKLKALSSCIASSSDNPLYITEYVGPLVCSESPHFLKCVCFRKVAVLDVCVYDVASLHEILSCAGLSCLIDVIIRVDLKADEQVFADTSKFVIPESVPLTLTVKYFEKLQDLLAKFDFPHFLKSLSIHDVYIHQKFRLDLSPFTNLISLFIRFISGEESLNDVSECPALQESMEIDENKSSRNRMLPSSHWTSTLANNLILPKGLERLLLRNMEFYNDSTNFLLLKFWKNCHIQRLIILDSSLSIVGVRNLLRNHFPNSDTENLEKSLKKHCKIDRGDSLQFRERLSKKPRLEEGERLQKRMNKPDGKELIITSRLGLCSSCRKFPCSCQYRKESRETLEELICLIEDIYCYDVLSFSFSSEILTVRKDMCGDLRVHCPLTFLDDDDIFNLENVEPVLCCLFRVLTLAQCISLDYTNLTHMGAVEVVERLKKGKAEYSCIKHAEPFSLTIVSEYHPKFDDEIINSTFINFLKNEDCLAQFNFRCCCKKRCHWVKKTRAGKIFVNDEPLDKF